MMKSMNEGHDSSSSTNWLGFSLSPHMKMEANTVSDPPPPPPGTFYNPSLTYAVPETGHFQSPLSIMPLKSDGSLCIMESPLSTSHTQGVVPNSSPKLEDFLGGATMGTNHHFQIHPTDAMALSLIDSSSPFYNQVPFRQQPQYCYYSGINCNGILQTIASDEHNQQQKHAQQIVSYNTAIAHQFPQISEDVMKTWMEHHHQLNLQVNDIGSNTASAAVVEEDRGGMGCGELQSLSLSMSPGSQSSCVTRQISPTDSVAAMETKKRGIEKLGGQQKPTVHRKSIDTFGQRTSQYRGVTRHRWTGRYEAHLWDNSCKKEGQTRKGRQVYLGGYDKEEKAARAYDLAALKYWGPSTHINFGLENYHQELEEMKNMSRQEYVAHLRRKSSGFSRGASIYRGVTRHHQHGRWQARIGRVAGNKDLYLGTFSTQEEAAEAYDIAAIKFRGANAVTNFDISRYDVEKIMASNTLPTGEIARRTKTDDKVVAEAVGYSSTTAMDNAIPMMPDWKMVLQNQETVAAAVEASVIPFNAKTINDAGPYHNNAAVTVALHDLITIESSQTVVDDSTATVAPHFSNPSSLVTSLSSSREASPEKYSAPALFAKPVTTWAPDTQARLVSLTAAHLPMFAAWNNV